MLDHPAELPEGLEDNLILGDALPTPRRLSVDPGAGAVRVAERVSGDSIVPRYSALMGEREDVESVEWSPRLRGPVRWTRVVLLAAEHLELTSTPAFTDNLL